jgi:hypothetical protein
MEATHRYWTVNICLISSLHIFSIRSNKVTSRDFEGRRTPKSCGFLVFSPVGLEVGEGSVSSSSSSSSDGASSSSPPEVGTGTGAGGGGIALAFPFALASVAVGFPLGVVFPVVLAEAFPLGLLSFLSMDLTVGGSCRLSPARISFFVLRMGIQQTYIQAFKSDGIVIG